VPIAPCEGCFSVLNVGCYKCHPYYLAPVRGGRFIVKGDGYFIYLAPLPRLTYVGIISFPHVQDAKAPFTWGYRHLQSLPGLIFLNLNFQILVYGLKSINSSLEDKPVDIYLIDLKNVPEGTVSTDSPM
jgi:hypothetical protein